MSPAANYPPPPSLILRPVSTPQLTHPSVSHNSLDTAQQLSLLKARSFAGLPPITLWNGPSLPASWQPDPRLVATLGHLRKNDARLQAIDLSGSPPADGDCLALALAAALAGNTSLTSLQLRACGIGALGAVGLGHALAGNAALQFLE